MNHPMKPMQSSVWLEKGMLTTGHCILPFSKKSQSTVHWFQKISIPRRRKPKTIFIRMYLQTTRNPFFEISKKDSVTQIAEMRENKEPICERRQMGIINVYSKPVGILATREKRMEDFHFAAVPMKEWDRIIPRTEIPLATSSP